MNQRKVIIADGRVDIRGMLKSSVTGAGVDRVEVCATVAEIIPHLQDPSQLPLWIIAGPGLDEPVNLLQIMKLILDHPELSDVRVSMILKEGMLAYAELGYELGLLSHHVQPFTTQSLQDQFQRIYQRLKSDPDHDYVTAAEYLKDALAEQGKFKELLTFERRMVNHFPKRPEFLLGLAEALHLAGENDEAITVLSKARFLGEQVRSQVAEVLSLVAPDKQVEDLSSFAQAFGVKNALVIDGDSIESKRAEKILLNLGVEKVQQLATTEEAMDFLFNGEFMPDLIVMEWRLKALPAAAFVQRLVNLTETLPPLIVTSSKLTPVDEVLLHELGAAGTLSKPYHDEELIHTFFAAIRDRDLPTNLKDLLRKLKEAVYRGEREEAKEAHTAIVQISNAPVAIRATADAFWKYMIRDYMGAKEDVVTAVKESKDNILLIDLLGKILLRLNQHDAAIKCFMKAAHLSPLNIARLCETAEICSETGKGEDAHGILNSARKIDAGSDRLILAESRVALNLGDTDAAQKAVMKMGNLNQLISYMNNRAVTMVRDDDVAAALNLYDDALRALPPERGHEKAVILFNKGLALARLQQADDAIATFKQINKADHKEIFDKSAGLIHKITVLRNAGKEISFAHREEASSLQLGRPTALYAYPGQIRLHLIFDAGDILTDQNSKLFKTVADFSINKIDKAS